MSEFEIHPPSHGVEVAFEDEGVNMRRILIVGVLSIGLFGLSLGFLDDLFSITREDEVSKVDLSVPSGQLLDMRNTETAILHSYKLLDSTKANYRIPIDRAMRLVSEEAYSAKRGER